MLRDISRGDLVRRLIFCVFLLSLFLPIFTPIKGVYSVILDRINGRYIAIAFKILYLVFSSVSSSPPKKTVPD
jgi:hypothetical protein